MRPCPERLKRMDFFLAGSFAFLGFVDGGGYGVARFRGRDDAFCPGKETACFERFQLLDVHPLP